MVTTRKNLVYFWEREYNFFLNFTFFLFWKMRPWSKTIDKNPRESWRSSFLWHEDEKGFHRQVVPHFNFPYSQWFRELTHYTFKVASRVSNVLVPAVQILQERTNNYSSVLNRDADVLETVRGRWCALLETQMATDKYEYWTRIFNTVVPDDNAGTFLPGLLE